MTQNKKSKVALVRCESYDPDQVESAVNKGLQLLGGIQEFIDSDDYVLLKPNLLSGHTPEEGVTTHPAVFRAVAKAALQASNNVKFGDSPPKGNPEKIATTAGLMQVADELGFEFVSFEDGEYVFYKDDQQTRKFKIANQVLKSDTLINVSKLKTHNLTRITGAVKNVFGCVSGLEKPEFHLKLPLTPDFSRMLVELCLLLKPDLHIMDGIMGMEGDGPNAGKMRPTNVLLFSRDPVALDTVFSSIINLKPSKVASNSIGKEMGLGNIDFDNIELVGDDLESFIVEDFDVYRGMGDELKPRNPILRMKFLKNWLSRKPVIDEQLCIKCGECIEQCPTDPKSLSREKNTDIPEYNYHTCIRCYCCQEICPEMAIKIDTPLLRKIVDYFYN